MLREIEKSIGRLEVHGNVSATQHEKDIIKGLFEIVGRDSPSRPGQEEGNAPSGIWLPYSGLLTGERGVQGGYPIYCR